MADIAQHITTNFPSPEDGDRFTWGGVHYTYYKTLNVWTGAIPEVGATITVTTRDIVPTNPNEGDLWFSCDEDSIDISKLYVYVAGDWIDTNPESAPDRPTPPEISIVLPIDDMPPFSVHFTKQQS